MGFDSGREEISRYTATSLLRGSGAADVGSVTLPKEEWLQEGPYHSISPMLAKHVGRISLSVDVKESDDFGGNSFPNTMKGKCRVALV